MTEARRGFFPFIAGGNVSLRQGGAIALIAKDNLQVTQGGGQLIGAGNSVQVSQGGSWLLGAGSKVTIDQGGAGIVGAREVRAERSVLGLVVGGSVEIEDSRVIVGSGGALLIGIVIGLVLGRRGLRRG